jgi:hypothetical protein
MFVLHDLWLLVTDVRCGDTAATRDVAICPVPRAEGLSVQADAAAESVTGSAHNPLQRLMSAKGGKIVA